MTELMTGLPPVTPEQGVFSLGELSRSEVRQLVRRSADFYRDIGAHRSPLSGRVAGILFTKTSTRTRTAFTTAAIRLGASPVTFGPHDLQTNTGESITDTGRILGSMLDLLVARTAGPLDELRELSRHGGIPVVNAMAAEEHPTQGICDLATISMCRGGVDGARIVYLGEGNNTATALAQGIAHFSGCQVTFATPEGYGLPAAALESAAKRAAELGTTLTQVHSTRELPHEADFVYTTRWQTTGTAKPDADWREKFLPFYVDDALMDRWPQARFLHDLPAHRGEEVAGSVLDGDRSVAWGQARMKLTSAMSTLEWLAGRL
ncbi:ornithine carbamoyltransferase [Streptomyces sp. Edi2]|uniref:ornithine carbamoyltransferase n=1 Tax=Streptomyces sp. Edi2 TaxID=3162528 RepID=UPI0033068BC9